MYDPALSFWSINSTGLLHPSCRPLWPPRISSAALAERLLWLGVEVRGWWDLLLMLWCVVNTFNYCCHCSWWLNGLPMGVPLGFMISETNGGPFEVIGIYRHVRDFETSGSTQKTTKNKHTVQTGLCHVLCLLFSLVIPHLCWGWKSTRNGLFTAYTWQIVKIGINHKHVVKCLEPTKTIPCCAFKIDK